MARGKWSRRWVALSGGVLINALILGALLMIEGSPPLVEEAPVIILELEHPRKRTPPPRSRAAAGARSAARVPSRSTVSEGEGRPAAVDPALSPALSVDPEWRVDPEAVDRWRLLEGNPAMGAGRFRRACLGQTSEHMTPEEKDACHEAWGKRPDKRPSPTFIGPIDERKWEVHQFGPRRPSTSADDKRRRRDLCRAYDRMRKADPSTLTVLRQGACP
ncbi:hypothetical protein B7G68_05695 [Caulobacter segnis]|uniref:Uncharacterized protein n=2 Tax=Caulobacter segnis TaxID=88688 RepID=D5VF74_CAUST|nr:hypothetical protein [Caulobacter segnis]ADG09606.1 hypothetical protein Cseg_1103 [Caulobacter segnis ATCC 21756]AVQ01386.1 hypothetical protein B7G68_05695 [Caulobacter segnis]